MKTFSFFRDLIVLSWLLPLTLAFAHERTGAADANKACEAFSGERKENCLELFKRVPNQTALSYTLRYLALNSGSLKDSSCVKHDHGLAKQGIRNVCRFVLNDVKSSYSGRPFQSKGYLVDLCAKNSSDLVRIFPINKGTGSAKFGYTDREGAHTTSLGAYLTGTDLESFQPIKMNAGYRQIRSRFPGKSRLTLVGLHSTNNDTSKSKPMHISPFVSSWGCPSISSKDADILVKLSTGGPSLVMNYGDPSAHPESSLTKCNSVAERLPAARKPTLSARYRHGRVKTRRGRGHHHVHHHRHHSFHKQGVVR